MSKKPAHSHGATARYKTVLITGSSSGIGRDCALVLRAAGLRVFAGVRSEGEAAILRATGPENIFPLVLDITNARQLEAAADVLRAELSTTGLDALVNNAGICVAGPLEYVSPEALRKQFEVNVIGQVALTQIVLPLLRLARGRIVNIGSTSGRIAGALTGPYCASKFALEALTSVLRMELLSSGVRVSMIEPGTVATSFWDKALAAHDSLTAELPPSAVRQYESALARRRAKVLGCKSSGSSTEGVCQAVVHAITARRPKLRYMVGTDAKLRSLAAAVLPDALRYYLAARRI